MKSLKSCALFLTLLASFATGARAADIDGTAWLVTGKSCNGSPLTLAGSEKMQFASAIFAHIFLSADDQTQYCNTARVYSRFVQSFSQGSAGLQETGVLQPAQERTVCRSKPEGLTLSDSTLPLISLTQAYSISLKDAAGYVELTGSPDCTTGILRFELKKSN
ncbi:MAG: hypothetical protein NDI60_04805 [Elusimicrobiales bacterium]|nr:hypothetical protein [Elusimicrobiales bacterium]